MVRSKKMSKLRSALLLVAFLLFPVTMNWMSPYLPMAGAAEGLIVGALLFYAILFIGSIFFGRLFCGWLCPMGALQESCFSIREKRVKPWIRWIKWVVWVPWFAMILGSLAKTAPLSVELLYLFEKGVSVDSLAGAIRYTVVVFAVFLMAVGGGKRFFCHSCCWIAPFMILGKKTGKLLTVPQLKLQSSSKSCTGCNRCSVNCPMSLDVQKMVNSNSIDSAECILCGNCTEVCGKSCIAFTFER